MKISHSGIWQDKDSHYHHYHDNKILNFIVSLLATKQYKTIVDFGCGKGTYVKALKEQGYEVDGYDGNPRTETLTDNTCSILELHKTFNLQKYYDLTICLEVGEHIPIEYQDIFLTNITKHTFKTLILSWATPGQGGFGHVSELENIEVIKLLENKGFIYDEFLSKEARKDVEYSWFKNTLMIFNKKNNENNNSNNL